MNVDDILTQHVFAVVCQQKYNSFLVPMISKIQCNVQHISNTQTHTHTHLHTHTDSKGQVVKRPKSLPSQVSTSHTTDNTTQHRRRFTVKNCI